MAERTTPKRPIQIPDPLKHFSKDGPWFRLGALLICKLPYIIGSVGMVRMFGKTKGWW